MAPHMVSGMEGSFLGVRCEAAYIEEIQFSVVPFLMIMAGVAVLASAFRQGSR